MPITTEDLLVRLTLVTDLKLTMRQIIILCIVKGWPGIFGNEVASHLGAVNWGTVQVPIYRLIDQGYLEDRRPVKAHGRPVRLHITQKGLDLLDRLTR